MACVEALLPGKINLYRRSGDFRTLINNQALHLAMFPVNNQALHLAMFPVYVVYLNYMIYRHQILILDNSKDFEAQNV